MPGALSVLPIAPRPVELPGTDGPPPSLLDQGAAAYRLARDDTTGINEQRQIDAYGDLVKELVSVTGSSASRYVSAVRSGNPVNEDVIWRDIAAIRSRNPKAFSQYGENADDFATRVLAKTIARRQSDKALTERGTGVAAAVAQFVGSLGGGLTDPINLATAPIGGGGKTIAQAVLREALVNAAVEAVQQPSVALQRQRYGEKLTTGEAVANVALAGVGGGALGGAGKALHLHGGMIGDAAASAREAVLSRVYAAMPAGVRKKWASASDIPDTVLADVLEQKIGVSNLAAHEKAALDIVREDVDVAARSPFAASPASDATHWAAMREAMDHILADAPARVPAGLMPASVPRPPSVRGTGLSNTTALSSGIVGSDPRAEFMRRVARAESPNDFAKNPRSSATGRYQMTRSTFIATYRKVMGVDDAAARVAWDTQRTDGALQDRLMGRLTADNAAALKHAGVSETAGNLYLAHFAGSGGAIKLHGARPDASVRSVLGDAVVRANPFLDGMTAHDVIAWAHRKMGGAIPANDPSLRIAARTDALRAGEVDLRARIAGEMDAINARLAEIDNIETPGVNLREDLPDLRHADDISARDAVDDAVPVVPDRRIIDDADSAAVSPDVPMASILLDDVPIKSSPPDLTRAEIVALLPQLRDIIDDARRPSLDVGRIAARLEVAERDVSQALSMIASRDGSLYVTRAGAFRRPPRERPVDLLKFVARKGGIDPSGRDDLATIFETTVRRGTKSVRSSAFIPGAGKLLRKGGMTLDDIGELIHEAGYWTKADRPSVDEVLELLQDSFSSGRKVYAMADLSTVASSDARAVRGFDDEQLYHYAEQVRRAAEDIGLELSSKQHDEVAKIAIGEHLEPHEALDIWFERQFSPLFDDAHFETGRPEYDDLWLQDGSPALDPPEAGRFAPDDPGPGPASGDAGQGEGFAANGGAMGESPWLDPFEGLEQAPAARADWEDAVHSDGAKAQSDSLAHDARLALDIQQAFDIERVDPNIAARQSQEISLKAASPLRRPVEQDGTMGLALFDASDQGGFVLDGGGDARGLTNIMEELFREDAEMASIKRCI